MSRAMVVVALVGCVVTPEPEEPSRMISGFAFRGGAAAAREDSPDGPDGVGAGFGAHGFVMGRINDRVAAGLGLDFTISSYDSKLEEPYNAGLWWVMLPTVHVRYELGRFALSSWGGYYIGFRSVTQPGGTFGTRTYSSQKSHGAALGAAFVRKLRMANGPSFEAGPYVQLVHLRSKEDDDRTQDFDEQGLASSALVGGLMLGLTFGAP